MADILIKGMEMPKSCQECFWVLGYDSIPNCPDIETSNLNDYLGDDRKGRHPDCPLEEVKEGVWFYYGNGVYECSECHEQYILDDTPTAHNYNFCPNCGSKMEG